MAASTTGVKGLVDFASNDQGLKADDTCTDCCYQGTALSAGSKSVTAVFDIGADENLPIVAKKGCANSKARVGRPRIG